MKLVTLESLRIALLVAAVGFLPPGCARAADEEEGTMRDLVRRYVKDKDPALLKAATGLDVQHVLALEHTILLVKDGKAEPLADPEKRQFKIGDQIRIRIRPVTDAYLYIFNEGASGERICLLPDKEEKAPLVKAGEAVDLPMDGGSFEFIAPPGKELVRVVATDKPAEDLAGLLHAVFKKQDLTPAEEDLKKSIRAKIEARLQSIGKKQDQTITYRGLLTKEAMKDVRTKVDQGGGDEIVLRELPNQKQTSTFTMVAGAKADAQPLMLTIPLQSIPEK
jgi:hypothetical protein